MTTDETKGCTMPRDRSDSDTTRRIRLESAEMCRKSGTRIWWAIGVMFFAICGIVGGGVTIAVTAKSDIRTNEARLDAANKRQDDLGDQLTRIEDKLDRLIERQ